ncbi:LGFP repeat-containing protein [Nocardia rhizosphaerihabitans]|uniref:LGFP repeat-containing protein n=1 Tax=Nocardia rhizosphaerihabitans TaxID=1691570 RepID=A0ABQ2L1A6_9NOCA|nr:trehalose corynomycolyl transferase [Nocardia rhizosphaerihabitans]GGN99436.1 hypothetical protein GCM10011610_67380 [Nocardia rhizosphaerihabitans]
MDAIRTIPITITMTVALAATLALSACDSNDSACCWPTAAIGTRYAELTGPTGPLGDCTSGEHDTESGRVQDFDHGAIYWSPSTGAWEVYGLIGQEYQRLGGPGSPLKWPVSGELSTPNGVGRFNRFQTGNIYSSPAGTYPVYGAIFTEWARQGYENGRLGFPTSEETDVPGGRRTNFEHGWIEWNAATGQLATG